MKILFTRLRSNTLFLLMPVRTPQVPFLLHYTPQALVLFVIHLVLVQFSPCLNLYFLLTPARTPQAVTFVLKNMFFGTFSKYMKGTSQNGWSCFHGARDHRDFGFQPVQPKPFRPTWMTDEREVTTYWLQKKYRRQARVVWAWAHGKFSRARGAVTACTAYVLFFSWAQSKGGKRRTKHAMKSKKSQKSFHKKVSKQKGQKRKCS